MTLHRIFSLIIGAALALSPKMGMAAPVVVVELFTSQSCSSCPPADRLLSALAQQPGVIALSCHVTYWDHLGWRDTLSQDFCTKRQYEYQTRAGDNGVYTPQMVVNGTVRFIGSHEGKARAALSGASPIQAVLITRSPVGRLHIALPALPATPSLDVIVFAYDEPKTQAIKSGENGGRSVIYTNPVIGLDKMPAWDGLAKTLDVMPSVSAPHYAVVIQDGPGGAVLAAGKI